MNEVSQLEKQLRSWTPRPPSAALKARIFGGAEAISVEPAANAEDSAPARVPAWQWLAPAMAVFVAAMMSWSDGVSSFISSNPSGVSSALSSPEMAAYYSPIHLEHNVWPIATFDWTNHRETLPRAATLPVTNSTTP
jgi:hypothetical protein